MANNGDNLHGSQVRYELAYLAHFLPAHEISRI